MLYFAYGSNLHHFQMKRRCKDSFFLRKIRLKDFKLTFRSKYRVMKKSWMCMRIIQTFIRNIIFIIMEKK